LRFPSAKTANASTSFFSEKIDPAALRFCSTKDTNAMSSKSKQQKRKSPSNLFPSTDAYHRAESTHGYQRTKSDGDTSKLRLAHNVISPQFFRRNEFLGRLHHLFRRAHNPAAAGVAKHENEAAMTDAEAHLPSGSESAEHLAGVELAPQDNSGTR